MRPTPPRFSKNAFTLIEVATALAIFAFASVGLISLIPMAIVTHKKAVDNTILAQITQQVTGEVQMCGPNEFAATYKQAQPQQWYFDYEGNQLSAGASGIVYRAEAVVSTVQLSGQTSNSTCLQLVKIYAVFDPTPNGTVLSGLYNQGQGIPNGVVVVNQPTPPTGAGGL